jgi:tetratricopeptide (TPR) repeat protein
MNVHFISFDSLFRFRSCHLSSVRVATMKVVGSSGDNISLHEHDVSSDEAMQYKNSPIITTKKKKLSKTTPKKTSSALRSSTSSLDHSLQKPIRKTKVSFSEDSNSKAEESLSSASFKRSDGKKKFTRAKQTSSTAAARIPPRRWNLGKRFPLFGGTQGGADSPRSTISKRKNGYGTLQDDLDDASGGASALEMDPVMTIFESRNTQRVRFTLEGDVSSARPSSTATAAEKAAVDASQNSINCEREGAADEKSGNEGQAGGVGGAASLKQFMSRTLFGGSKSPSNNQLLEEEMKREVKELGGDGSLIWESARTLSDGPEVVKTHNSKASQLLLSFTEDPKARAAVTKLLGKARRAEHVHFRYEYAVKCYVRAINILKKAKYPDDHPTVVKTVKLMNNAHHVLSSYHNSANIVKMGIKNEDAGELIKALKMYTIAYRIRRDNLSRNHPSLVVLLNMLGSIQIKRGELNEAMDIYELALNDSPVIFSAAANGEEEIETPVENLPAKSVTYREMGTIHEMWGNVEEALQFYHRSLECVGAWRARVRRSSSTGSNNNNEGRSRPSLEIPSSKRRSSSLSLGGDSDDDSTVSASTRNVENPQCAIDDIRPMSFVVDGTDASSLGVEHGEMELVIGSSNVDGGTSNSDNVYEKYFPKNNMNAKISSQKESDDNSHADMDLSLTLHQIAQLYRAQGKFSRALDAFEVALRGMKTALGKHHPNVAAVLGNIGNLQKEMGDLDAAYQTYQEVLGIESYRLGLSHPDVAVTLHNIATIDAARGNFDHALQLYRKVIGLQKKLFGEDNLSVAVTAACMGDVYEKIGELENSMDSFDEAIRIKSAVLGRHSLDVGRLLHKLSKLSFLRKDYLDAESYIARAILIYRLNKLSEDHQWFVDAKRDTADIDAAIATGTPEICEI